MSSKIILATIASLLLVAIAVSVSSAPALEETLESRSLDQAQESESEVRFFFNCLLLKSISARSNAEFVLVRSLPGFS